ncbi:phosphodiester glycosidase family protein [Caloranaerobacter azorensis]|uniref:Phosphodiester glycosidase family protein n=1 Tax=Caloranaerobacter azorensis TaxID=116090 RepID=A0A6P1YEM2_9FIRM|nr:phosphodiester glycosidase family protein [Caloranaerobacter azorensis]QIB27537.1 phosphodiester glycosidase family protein [Caloranaerobacter azorensis]
MNKLFKRVVSYIAGGVIIFSSFSMSFAAKPILLHEWKNTENISSGVIHEHIQKFTSDGWWNINVLRVNLKDKYTNLDVLFNKEGISKKDTLSNMIKNSQAIAGINGDFFSTAKSSFPLGVVVSNGKMVSSPPYHWNRLPIFAIDKNNYPFISFWKWEIKAVPEGGQPVILSAINKSSNKHEEVILYDKNWSLKSIGNTYFNDMIEIVVEKDIVKEVRIGQPPIDMPENGYILTGRGRVKNVLLNNFKVGKKVKLEINTMPNYENIKTAIGSGTFIVKDGNIADFTLNIKGKHPRTALGINKDKDELILVTIDGRDTSYKGVDLNTLAEIMIDLGAYEAVNLDGGGSTTMVLKPQYEENPIVVNHPSDGKERRISNGLGIFNNAPKKNLSYIKIYTDDTNIFVNTSRNFYVRGFDKYHNPVDIDIDRVKFSVSGIKGNFNKNTLIPKELGKGKVIARYKGKKAEIEINVLNEVKELQFNFDKFHIDVNSQKDLTEIYGKNDEGYTAKINPKDINWTIYGNIGKIVDGIFYSSKKPSSGAITAKLMNAVQNIEVSVGYNEILLEDFENLDNLNFIGYPQEVNGNIKLDNEDVLGKFSLKLNYDFTNSEKTTAAYITLGENGIKLENKPTKLGLWLYGNGSNHWFRGKIIDSSGKSYYIDFVRNIDWDGWKWIEADIPDNVAYPITLDRIYIVETSPCNKDKGYILIDGLKALYATPYETMTLPAETHIEDKLQKSEEIGENGFSFIVARGIEKADTLLKRLIAGKIDEKINENHLGIILGKMNNIFIDKIKVPFAEASNGYSYFVNNNTLFIQLDDTKNGLRTSDVNQWIWLKDILNKSNEKNVIISLPKPVFGKSGFTDKLEAELFHKILTDYRSSGKNIFVIQGSNRTVVKLKDGIRYIEVEDIKLGDLNDLFDIRYVRFVVNGDKVTYEILPLLKN